MANLAIAFLVFLLARHRDYQHCSLTIVSSSILARFARSFVTHSSVNNIQCCTPSSPYANKITCPLIFFPAWYIFLSMPVKSNGVLSLRSITSCIAIDCSTTFELRNISREIVFYKCLNDIIFIELVLVFAYRNLSDIDLNEQLLQFIFIKTLNLLKSYNKSYFLQQCSHRYYITFQLKYVNTSVHSVFFHSQRKVRCSWSTYEIQINQSNYYIVCCVCLPYSDLHHIIIIKIKEKKADTVHNWQTTTFVSGIQIQIHRRFWKATQLLLFTILFM